MVTDLTPCGGFGSTMSARMNWGLGVLPSSMIALESCKVASKRPVDQEVPLILTIPPSQPALPVMRIVVADMIVKEDRGDAEGDW